MAFPPKSIINGENVDHRFIAKDFVLSLLLFSFSYILSICFVYFSMKIQKSHQHFVGSSLLRKHNENSSYIFAYYYLSLAFAIVHYLTVQTTRRIKTRQRNISYGENNYIGPIEFFIIAVVVWIKCK